MSNTQLSIEQIEVLLRRVFQKHGCDDANTDALVNTIVSAEKDGALSHGLFRVPGYIASLKSGKVNGKAKPTIIRQAPTVIKVDANNGFAPLALEESLPLLSKSAQLSGIAVLAIERTHHFSALWPETEYLASRGLIGISCTSYIANVAPFGGTQPIFGTNPISFACPRQNKEPIVFDMATSSMAMGEVQIAAREGKGVELGTGLNNVGELTTDPSQIIEGMLLPFGGHKGSALSLMVELLAAVATGDRFSYEAKECDNYDGGPAQGGQLIIALNPSLIGSKDWLERVEKFCEKYNQIPGARLPGTSRHKLRNSGSNLRSVNKALLEEITKLCE